MKQKICILGTGMVGQVLASGFLKHGHDVMIGTRSPEKVSDWQEKNPRGKVGSNKEAAAWADIIVLATKGTAAEAAIRLCDSKDLQGKIIRHCPRRRRGSASSGDRVRRTPLRSGRPGAAATDRGRGRRARR